MSKKSPRFNFSYSAYSAIVIIVAVAVLAIFFLSRREMAPGNGGAYDSTEISGLPEAKPMETVELKDGDTYELSAGYVAKGIDGMKYRMLAYNGSIPGPLLKIPQGAKVTIRFTNRTDMKTLLHSHGVRMENAFDGAQTAQKEMAPGESFDYVLKFPDAGIYWYHPHVREDYQQELGLYGNFLVVPSDSGYWPPANSEAAIFLDDILIAGEKTKRKILLSKEKADHTLMGRYGNVFLINGETDYSLAAKKGEVVRLFVTNAANARPFNFAIENTKLKLVGSDGGAYEKAHWRDSVILAPSERAIVDVLFETAGTFAIQNKIPNRTDVLGKITVSREAIVPEMSYASQFRTLQTNRETKESIAPFRQYFDLGRVPKKFLRFTLGGMMGGMSGHTMNTVAGTDGIEWESGNETGGEMGAMMGGGDDGQAQSQWKIIDDATGKENMRINDWVFKKGEPVKIRIFNDPNAMHAMDHPLHFHGQRFLILARNGAREENSVWKDTVLVPAGHTIDILLLPDNSGTWMAHCHIAEHLEDGMSFVFEVKE